MHLTVLAVPGCPNVAVLDDRITTVLHDRAGVEVSHQVISDQREAERWGMHGSPTLLIDGTDPFAEPGQSPALSCRLYLDEDGQLSGAPSIRHLHQVIDRAMATGAGPQDPARLDETTPRTLRVWSPR
jgi:predicted DsbA family dithiol-disulfide isomerase